MSKKVDREYGCTIMQLPEEIAYESACTAARINPANRPAGVWEPSHLAVITTKYWGASGTELTVGFMEQIQSTLRNRILSHMNAWSEFCNVKFKWTQTSPQVRIAFGKTGYWSYLGTDILSIPANQPTMNLQGFSNNTSEREFIRVVRHETGHTMGFPHEHMRRELVDKLDREKTIAYFSRTQGWDRRTVEQQVLTPLDEKSLMGTEHADADSIMCYQLPGSITVDGSPILGGTDLSTQDKAFATKLYPLSTDPKQNRLKVTFTIDLATKTVTDVETIAQ